MPNPHVARCLKLTVVMACFATLPAMSDPLLSPFSYYGDDSVDNWRDSGHSNYGTPFDSGVSDFESAASGFATTPSTLEEPELAKALPQRPPAEQAVYDSVVSIHTVARDGARTVTTFGENRKGSGIVIDANGLIATAGYLITEAESIKVTFANGIVDDAEVVAYDDALGVGLIRTENYKSPHTLSLGYSSEIGDAQKALVLPASGDKGASVVTIGAVKSFMGAWEYLLEDAIHTYPPTTDFSGAALISENAELLGIGALVTIDIDIDPKVRVPGNVFVPIDSVKAVMGELLSKGRSDSSVKPWLGMDTKDSKAGLKIGSVYENAPAAASGLKTGDMILAVDQKKINSLKQFYSTIWEGYEPGDTIHLLVLRDNQFANVPVKTVDRYDWLMLEADDSNGSDSKETDKNKYTESVE